MAQPAFPKVSLKLAPGDKILVAEDHPLVLKSLKSELEATFPDSLILEAVKESEIIRHSCENKIGLAVLDVFLDGIKTFESLRQLKIRQPNVKTVLFTGHVSAEVLSVGQDLGVEGYVSKATEPSELVEIINQVLGGDEAYCPRFQKAADLQTNVGDDNGSLTRREREIFDYTLLGMTVQEIAKAANISHTTVKKHRQNILRKLNFTSSAKLLAYAKLIKIDRDS